MAVTAASRVPYVREGNRGPYLKAITERFPAGDVKPDRERAVDYIYRALDRQINKARGLLTYNGLLFSALNFSADRSPAALLGGLLALISCIPLLFLFLMNWGADSTYKSADSDFEATFSVVMGRSLWLTVSLLVSLSATLIAAYTVIARLC